MAAASAKSGRRFPNWAIGLIALAAVVFGFYLAFVKSLPFVPDNRFELKAVFQDAQSIRVKSPVRAAGVEVGQVTEVDHLYGENGDGEDASVVTMRIKDEGLPIREDVALALRPRLFLEGNLFVELKPGSPSAPELESGAVVPMSQTQISVQFDQVLTALQKPVRTQLQSFLHEFGGALTDFGGGKGFQELFRSSPDAYRFTAEVNEAFLGTEPGDLRGFIRGLGDTIEALDRNQVQLQDLLTNLRIVTGSFAAEAESLELGIAELPRLLAVGRPALAKLNSGFPALRAFAREALPGTRAANAALTQATPWIRQLQALVRPRELRGLVSDLRPTIPRLATLAKATVPFLRESRALSSCFNRVVIPWSNLSPPSVSDPADVIYKETGWGLAGLAGESRSGDSQGQQFRVLGAGGANTIVIPAGDNETGELLAGTSQFPLLGTQPAKQSSLKTPFRPDVPCETQELPDLATGATDIVPSQFRSDTGTTEFGSPRLERIIEEALDLEEAMREIQDLRAQGKNSQAEALERQVYNDLAAFNGKGLREYKAEIARLTGVRSGD